MMSRLVKRRDALGPNWRKAHTKGFEGEESMHVVSWQNAVQPDKAVENVEKEFEQEDRVQKVQGLGEVVRERGFEVRGVQIVLDCGA
jgi:hypothetical protein